MFDELKQFKRDKGHCRVPAHTSKLGRWVERQRTLYRVGKIDSEKIERLESVGFQWKLQKQAKPRNPVSTKAFDEKFDEMEKKVISFAQKEGHCRIPQNYKEDPALGSWVKNRRSERKRGTLDKKKEDRLSKIGFVWEVTGGRGPKSEKKEGKHCDVTEKSTCKQR